MLSEEIFPTGSNLTQYGQDLMGLLLTLMELIGGILSKQRSVLKRSYYASYNYNFSY